MDKALTLALEDLGERFRTQIPFWILGTGADFGKLHRYARHLSFSLIAYVFYQELLDDARRTREDLIQTVLVIATTMKLECGYREAEKIVDALFVSEGSQKHTFAFHEQYFDERTKSWESFRFQFFELDKDISELDEGHFVYKLSSESQELFLMTNDIQKQLPISIQQLLVELLIEKGDLKTAIRLLEGLNKQALTLIKEEKHHKDELIRNPKKTVFDRKSRWGEQLTEVQQQFKEETEKYGKLSRILKRIRIEPNHQDIYLQLTRLLNKTGNVHDSLAKLVIENIRIEIQIRNRHFRGMWLLNTTSFKQTVWEDMAMVSGFAHPEDMLFLAESVFSPSKPSILPIEWALEEQTESILQATFGNLEPSANPTLEPICIDWESILLLWKPIFQRLLESNEVSIHCIQELDEVSLARWEENHEALDFWLLFGAMEEVFPITEENLYGQNDDDDKAVLLRKILEDYPELEQLRNKQIRSISGNNSIVLRKRIDVSQYTLKLEECVKNESTPS